MVGSGVAAAIAVFLAVCPAAFAAFPGDNGRLALVGEPFAGPFQADVYSLNSDDTGLLQLTDDAAVDRDVAWSPDGRRIAFASDRDGDQEIHVMNADGSGAVQLTTDPGSDTAPAWSPDGTRIAFVSDRDGDAEIFVMDADGSDQANLTQNAVGDGAPAWSPDGTRIAFSRGEIYAMNTDGSDIAQLTHVADESACSLFPCNARTPDWSPDGTRVAYVWSRFDFSEGESYEELRSLHLASGQTSTLNLGGDAPDFGYSGGDFLGHSWSPDGTKIAWVKQFAGLQVADADGSDPVALSSTWIGGFPRPSWQPVIHKEFPRPKGATPLRVSLVVSFNACGDGDMNRVHGPPLASPSCGGSADYPRAASPYVTVGAPDWNGASANFAGSVRLDAVLGNRLTPEDEADVRIAIHATDVRCYRTNPIAACGSDNYDGPAMGLETGRDYNGELRGRVPVHLTDENNSPFPGDGTGPGTVRGIFSFYLPVLVPCAETPGDITIGSTCSVQTTADAVIPGLVPEQKRSLWGVGQISVSDGGSDGDADTTIDNYVFLKQGLFVP